MAFEVFLAKWQNMYDIFEEEGEPMEEDAKYVFSLNKLSTQTYWNQLSH